MTTAAGQSIELPGPRRSPAPFLVSGTVCGRSVAKAVHSPADVLEEILHWCDRDPNATGNWQVSSDYSEPITLIARLKAGLARETRRIVHLFRLLPGVPLGHTLTARCGEALPIADTEWLAVGTGMPCESCLGLAARDYVVSRAGYARRP
ncbi:hypothetical protein [Gandjariella thermophila]|uniref:Uncharacterized protein n=1 Tax=Gandjariella thermophila TaxID=1931992 RepID=A0A4D4JCH4_9PSEU|nr:hypothetical protein [Gandjariella thermophila]GDY32069.1 hypothetical protein GTS_37020 [Gandjariella thermophila]